MLFNLCYLKRQRGSDLTFRLNSNFNLNFDSLFFNPLLLINESRQLHISLITYETLTAKLFINGEFGVNADDSTEGISIIFPNYFERVDHCLKERMNLLNINFDLENISFTLILLYGQLQNYSILRCLCTFPILIPEFVQNDILTKELPVYRSLYNDEIVELQYDSSRIELIEKNPIISLPKKKKTNKYTNEVRILDASIKKKKYPFSFTFSSRYHSSIILQQEMTLPLK